MMEGSAPVKAEAEGKVTKVEEDTTEDEEENVCPPPVETFSPVREVETKELTTEQPALVPKKKHKRREVELLKKATPATLHERTSHAPSRWGTELAILQRRQSMERKEHKARKKIEAEKRRKAKEEAAAAGDPNRPAVCSYCKATGTLRCCEMKPQGDGNTTLLRYDCKACSKTQWILVAAAEATLTPMRASSSVSGAETSSVGDGSSSESGDDTSDENFSDTESDRSTDEQSSSEASASSDSDAVATKKKGRKRRSLGSWSVDDPLRPTHCEGCGGDMTYRRNGSAPGRGQRYICRVCGMILYSDKKDTDKKDKEKGKDKEKETKEVTKPKDKEREKARQTADSEGTEEKQPKRTQPPSPKKKAASTAPSPKKSKPTAATAEKTGAAATKPITECDVGELSEALRAAGVPDEIISKFASEEIDGAALAQMSNDDFKALGVKFGPSVKIRGLLAPK